MTQSMKKRNHAKEVKRTSFTVRDSSARPMERADILLPRRTIAVRRIVSIEETSSALRSGSSRRDFMKKPAAIHSAKAMTKEYR